MKQLALQLTTSGASFKPDDYLVTDANRVAHQTVMHADQWPTSYAFLSGPPGSGKTHLASIWGQRQNAQYITADQLNDTFITDWQQSPHPLVIDQLQTLQDEASLFHILNLAKETKTSVLVVGTPNALAEIKLPDLKSRLMAAPKAPLEQPDDEMVRGLLIKHFSDRQLQITPDILQYLVNHIDRSGTAIEQLVRVVDEQALEKKRKISIAFLRKYLQGPRPSVNVFVKQSD